MTQVSNSVKVSTLIDARGPRFSAAITTVVKQLFLRSAHSRVHSSLRMHTFISLQSSHF
jgi:hypothetical protein